MLSFWVQTNFANSNCAKNITKKKIQWNLEDPQTSNRSTDLWIFHKFQQVDVSQRVAPNWIVLHAQFDLNLVHFYIRMFQIWDHLAY